MASWLVRARGCGSSSLFVPILLVLGAIGYLAWRQSVPAVRVEFQPVPQFIGARTPITLVLRASRGGVESVDIRLNQGGTRVNVAQQTFSRQPRRPAARAALIVAGGTLGLREGAATWKSAPATASGGPSAGRPDRSATCRSRRPHAAHARDPGRHALSLPGRRRAGRVARQGRRPGRRQRRRPLLPRLPDGPADSGLHALLYRAARGTWRPRRRSPPRAGRGGQRRSRALRGRAQPRPFPMDTIEMSEAFLESEVPELLPQRGRRASQLLDAFSSINRDQRKQAEERSSRSAPRPPTTRCGRAPSSQPRNTKVFSNFAETRTYVYGAAVDTQVHVGFDLASTKQPDAGRQRRPGRLRGPLTIYGNAVILDHGWACRRSTRTCRPSA